ncbi:hypothetical protein SNR37_003162 [Agarivorans aestuarii]|uniref:LysM domain-containing protein n=1 Tax=Agarivorans aestuarii TaxID=1563703 RepID=A0ABU7G5L7_9ALTE|nr:hypothetical protein [Agarivorans aestuarii]MEE1673735.1 hypothetical protein [Agarivorans aestuarii]
MGTAQKLDIPDEYVFHIVEELTPLDSLISKLYQAPSEVTIQHFINVNRHIIGGVAQVGQVVLISPANSNQCTLEEEFFYQEALKIEKIRKNMSQEERKALAQHYQTLENIAKYNGLLLGNSNNVWKAHVSQVKLILKELDNLYVNDLKAKGKLKSPAFLVKRNQLLARLDKALNRVAQPKIGAGLLAGNLKSNLGLSTKSIVHQWRKVGTVADSMPQLSKQYQQIAKTAGNLKRVGYLGIALAGVEATANIAQACQQDDKEACNKSKYVETGGAVGGVLGGAGGGSLATWGVCTIIFGLPSSGTSFFWCAIAAGGAGGVIGAKALSSPGKALGESIYKMEGNGKMLYYKDFNSSSFL